MAKMAEAPASHGNTDLVASNSADDGKEVNDNDGADGRKTSPESTKGVVASPSATEASAPPELFAVAGERGVFLRIETRSLALNK